MNTTEAIEFLDIENDPNIIMSIVEIKNRQKLQDIIKLLQRGEKYEAMWEEFRKEYIHKPIIREYYKNGVCKPYRFIGKMMGDFRQKYFPMEKP